MNGLVLIDKPAGWTSHDVVNRWRKLAGTKRAGHLGTLDPMATGLLGIVTGTATRLSQFFGNEEKTYLAEITFGWISDTYDAEGERTETVVAVPPCEAIVDVLASFRGRMLQTPPPVSAKKIGGVPAYKLARKHVAVELKPVEIEVKELDILGVQNGKAELRLTVSSGAYVRGIAHDAGQRLGCGALLSRLRRTKIGDFTIEQAKTMEQLTELAENSRLSEAVLPAAQLLPRFPAEHFPPEIEAQIRQGREFRTSPFIVAPGAPFVKALSYSGELIAIGQLKFPNVYHPATVLKQLKNRKGYPVCYTSNKIYMMWRKALLLLAAALLWMAGALLAQNPPSAKSPQTPPANTEPKTKGDFFAGTVVSLTSTQITVARDVAEGSVEQRSFRITKDTKLSNAVKVRSHVTVHYEHEDGTDVAIEIQIRPVLHPKGAS